MTNFKKNAGKLIVLGLVPLAMVACGESTISFSQDIKPILDTYCMECHVPGGQGEVASGFNMATHETLMKGARFGPMVIVVVLMEGRADPSISMPHGQQKTISKPDIQTIRLWIDQGAKNN